MNRQNSRKRETKSPQSIMRSCSLLTRSLDSKNSEMRSGKRPKQNETRVIQGLVDQFSREGLLLGMLNRLLAPDVLVKCDHQSYYATPAGYNYRQQGLSAADLLITPSYNVRRTPHILERAVRQRSHIILQHSEQLFPEVFDEEKFNLSRLRAYRQDVAAHIVWGKSFARQLVEKANINPRDIYICGNPKLELARRFYHRTINNKKTAVSSRNKKQTILVASNFLWGDYDDKYAQKIYKSYKTTIDIPTHRYWRKFRENALKLVSELAEEFPSIDFVLRPHPGESQDPYARLSDRPNIYMSRCGEFAEDLSIADMVFIHSSTSVFEILASGKNAISMDVGRLPDHLGQPPLMIFDWADKKRLRKILQDLKEDNKIPPVSDVRMNMLEESMHDPMGNSIGKHAAAYMSILHHIDEKTAPYEIPKNRLRAFWQRGIFSTKDQFLKVGLFLEVKQGKSNAITRLLRHRWDKRLQLADIVTDSMWERVLEEAAELLTEDDYNYVRRWPESLKLTKYGWEIQ